MPTAEPATETLMTAILLAGASSDPDGVVRDLAALMLRYRSHDQTGADRVIAATKSALGSSQAALDLLAKVDRLSRGSAAQPFGPVRDVDPAAVDRLALLTMISFLDYAFFSDFTKGIGDFVAHSQGAPPALIKLAASVQERLGQTTLDALRWRDGSVVALLASSFDEVGLVVAATGGNTPSEWSQAVGWITPWVNSRDIDPTTSFLDDGFSTGDHPAALHPLVLRILQPRISDMLSLQDNTDVDQGSRDGALAFCRFLADRGIAADAALSANPLIFPPAASPGTLFSAGALLIGWAQDSGVSISADGTPSGGMPVLAGYADRILKALIFGCERDFQPLPQSWTDKLLPHQLLQQCPAWAKSRFGGPLLGKATALALAATVTLSQQFKQAPSLIPPEVLGSDVDNFAASPARPRFADIIKGNPLQQVTDSDAVVQRISDDATLNRRAFDGWLSGPIGEPILLKLLPTGGSNHAPLDMQGGPVGTHVTSRMALLAGATLSDEFLHGTIWAALVKASAPEIADLLPNWAALECWDGLRGRLVHPSLSPDDRKLAIDLANALPDWLTDPDNRDKIEINDVRPLLAAIGLLGLPVQAVDGFPPAATLPNLIESLRQRLSSSSSLDPNIMAVLAATEIELTISFVAASSKNRGIGGVVLRSRDDLQDFLKFAASALRQPIAWQARAGFNAFILLSRLAELTDDPVIADALASVPKETGSIVDDLVASSVARAMAPATSVPTVSGLPLSIAASSLARFARNRLRALSAAPVLVPSWLDSSAMPPASKGNPDDVMERLTDAMSKPNALTGFAWQGGRAGRALLLALYQLKLQTVAASRCLTVEPLRADNPGLRQLRQLDVTSRQFFCIEQLLLTGLPKRRDGARVPPWWSVRFWATAALHKASDAVVPASPDPAFPIINWASSSLAPSVTSVVPPVELSLSQLAVAASLAGEIPVVREGEPTDIDQRSEFALPSFSFQAAKAALEGAIAALGAAEDKYDDAIVKQATIGNQAEIIALLKKPLLLETADASEQVQAAEAEVRRAGADLAAAEHEFVASQFEAASVRLIYQASLTAVERQKILKTIADLDHTASEFETAAQKIQVDVTALDQHSADLMREKAKNLRDAALARLDQATQSRAFVLEKATLLEFLLRTPQQIDVPGVLSPVQGMIRYMGNKTAFSLAKKLSDDLDDAERDLAAAIEEEERRRALERESSFIKGILSVVGAVVGFAVGGPAGAALGSTLTGAVGDVVGGIITKEPIETLIVGLAQDAFTVAKAGGVDLNGVLANVGSVFGSDADRMFSTLDTTLQPVLANIPTVLNEPVLRDALKDLTFVNPGSNPTADQRPDLFINRIIEQILTSSSVPDDLGSILADAGLRNPVAFDDAGSFIQLIASRVADGLSGEEPTSALLNALRGLAGLQQGARVADIAQRLSTLAATRIGMAMTQYRTGALQNWIARQQSRHKQWSEVETAGNQLLARLFPEPVARSKVLANVQLTLMNPRVFQAELQTKLMPWQQELDNRIAAVRAAGESALQGLSAPTNAVSAAQARVNYIEASRQKFFDAGGLLDFLTGNPPQRMQLIADLDQVKQDDATARAEIQVQKSLVDAAGQDVEIAHIALQKADDLHKQAAINLEKCKVGEEIAQWQQQYAELGIQEAQLTAQAQDKAEKAAEQKQEACEARIDAAQAALEARRALVIAAKLRATEASRIRDAISRPPVRLQADAVLEGTMAAASASHVKALERGLGAARDILRLVRLVPPQGGRTKLDDPVSGPKPFRWSEFLRDQLAELNNEFATSGARFTTTPPLALGAAQITALLSPGGLRLILRPKLDELIEGDRIQRSVNDDDARNGRIVGIFFVPGPGPDGSTFPSDRYRSSAQYRGEHWIMSTNGAEIEMHFLESQGLSASRLLTIPPGTDPQVILTSQGLLHLLEGDPTIGTIVGSPVSGTTILRFKAVGPHPPPIINLGVIVLYNTMVPN